MKKLKQLAKELLLKNGFSNNDFKLRYSKNAYGDKCVRVYPNCFVAYRYSEAPDLSLEDLKFEGRKEGFVKRFKTDLETYK